MRPLEDFARDLALAVRMLRKTPAFTAVAVITLALAIGANTGIFSLIDAVLLRPLNVPEADRLTLLRIQPSEFGYAFNYPLFKYVQRHAEVFSQVFAFSERELQIRGRDGMERHGKALIRAYHDFADGLAAVPGVRAASFVEVIPLEGSLWTGDASVPGQGSREVHRNLIGPAYFRAMHTPLLAGREFRWTDTDESGRVAILNEAAAQMLFPGRSPLGERILVDDAKTIAEVVGVVANTKYTSLSGADPPTVYSPITQDVKNKPSFAAVLRVNGSPGETIAAAQKTIRRTVPEILPPVAMTMEQNIADSLAKERMVATLALFFAGVALLIIGIGLYGTLAYATERRTGEIGIRLALGAQRGDVISMICRENGAIALAGCILGIAGSLGTSRLIASFLYGTSPHNPVILIAAALLLVIAAGASLTPSVRAAGIDPIAAIRYE